MRHPLLRQLQDLPLRNNGKYTRQRRSSLSSCFASSQRKVRACTNASSQVNRGIRCDRLGRNEVRRSHIYSTSDFFIADFAGATDTPNHRPGFRAFRASYSAQPSPISIEYGNAYWTPHESSAHKNPVTVNDLCINYAWEGTQCSPPIPIVRYL
ncbi:hypothetical protein MVEN_02376900 [Mycena venus]|uniref:Uncharacterized protein n=1 Tax=Mycena venus TaxID=2733690 RepID=A0A8H7CDE4_9AGAR|nr:hypothetical protein MVEN_02376900 [Mycena venus]